MWVVGGSQSRIGYKIICQPNRAIPTISLDIMSCSENDHDCGRHNHKTVTFAEWEPARSIGRLEGNEGIGIGVG